MANTNKIREAHIFWWYISNYGEIRQDVVSYNRLYFRFAQQSVWLSIFRAICEFQISRILQVADFRSTTLMIEPKWVIRPIQVQFQGGMLPSDLAQQEVIVGAFFHHSSLFDQKVVSLHADVLYFFSNLNKIIA